jgi:hypothetical protein
MKSPELRKFPLLASMESKFEIGLDSDGEGAPVADEEEEYEEEIVRERGEDGTLLSLPGANVTETEENIDENQPRHIEISDDAMKKLSVKLIRHELRIRQVQFTATLKKPELLERLRLAVKNEVKVTVFGTTADDVAPLKKKAGGRQVVNDMTGFTPGSYWEVLQPLVDPVTEPINTIRNARAPTVPEDEAGTIPVKHDFAEAFDRPIFTGKKQVQRLHPNGRKMFDEDGNPVWMKVSRKTITPRRDFLHKHKLTRFSDPVEFANAFIPWSENPYDTSLLSMHSLCSMTNLKANLANAGPGGTCYRTFVPFTVKEIRQHLGLYIWN